MSGFCPHCGNHEGFPSKEEGSVKCTSCGVSAHMPDKVQCPGCSNLSSRGTSFCADCGRALFKLCSQCEKRGPADASFCAECGGRLTSHTDLTARKGAEQAAASRRKAIRTLFLTVISVLLAWIACVAPVLKWFEREGISTSDFVIPTNAPDLSQAQIQATQQAEITVRTAAFEDIEISLGDVVEKKRTFSNDSWDDMHTYVEVIVENKGNATHHVLFAYEFGGDTQYQDLTIQPRSSESFVVENVAGLMLFGQRLEDPYSWDDTFFLARIEAIDGLNRKDIPLDPYDWDWEIRFVSFGSLDDYPCDYGECR